MYPNIKDEKLRNYINLRWGVMKADFITNAANEMLNALNEALGENKRLKEEIEKSEEMKEILGRIVNRKCDDYQELREKHEKTIENVNKALYRLDGLGYV
jgi:hypothetical protein